MRVTVAVVLVLAGCNGGTPGDTETCSTAMWSGGGGGGDDEEEDEEEGPTMAPGEDCVACHARGEGPDFTVAGTVMTDYADMDGCTGVDGVTVRITGADDAVTELETNASGNFYTLAAIATPYTIELEKDGATRAMGAAQTDGDCMSCHTSDGANAAPGRILAP
jgi:hypothetical protein